MTTTPENAAASWRDLADQLTPEQVAKLDDSEKGYRYRATLPQPPWSTAPRSGPESEALLLSFARRYACDNLVEATTPTIDPPVGATACDIWQEHDPLPYRVVFGAFRMVTDHAAVVSSSAVQWADGSIDDGGIEAPAIALLNDGTEAILGLDSDQARELAAALLEAADELDRWVTR